MYWSILILSLFYDVHLVYASDVRKFLRCSHLTTLYMIKKPSLFVSLKLVNVYGVLLMLIFDPSTTSYRSLAFEKF